MLKITRRRLQSWALTGVATGALLAPLAARAADAAADSGSGAAPAAAVEEVVVTAQRRGERIKDVPLTVTNTTGGELQQLGITSTRELSSVVPGVVMGMKGNFAQPSIRGISTPGTGPGLESNVSIYLDDIYMPSQTTNVFDLADVERIEVLKGPQGTLFGRNSTGGAIRIFTSQPSFDPQGHASVSYGSFNDVKASAFVTGPIIGDKLAGSLSGYYHHNDGYVDDLVDGGHYAPVKAYMVRGKLLAQLSDNLKVTLAAYGFHNEDATGFAMQPQGGNSLARRFTPGLFVPTDPLSASLDTTPYAKVESFGASAKVEWDIDNATFTSTTGGQFGHLTGTFDGDYLNSHTLEYDPSALESSYQQEFIYASKYAGRFNWIAGVFGFYDLGKYNPSQAVVLGKITDIYSRTSTVSYAAFAEGNFDVTDRLQLTAGARYSWDKKQFDAVAFSGLLTPVPPTPALTDLGGHSWDAITPRFVAKYKLTDEANIYASYTTGFTSGSYSPSAVNATPVNPEHIKAFEAGFKAATSRFTFNAAAFHYDYSDLQVSVVNGLFTVYQNATSAKIYGLDLDGSFAVTDRFKLRGGLTAMHARYGDFPNAAVNVPNAASVCAVTGGSYPCGNVTVAIDASGKQLPKAPDFTSSLTAEYDADAFGGNMVFSGTWYHNSGYPWEPGGRINQPQYDTLSANVSWAPANGKYKVSVWGRNLGNEKYEQSEFDTSGGDGVVYAPPRWFGVSLDVNF